MAIVLNYQPLEGIKLIFMFHICLVTLTAFKILYFQRSSNNKDGLRVLRR